MCVEMTQLEMLKPAGQATGVCRGEARGQPGSSWMLWPITQGLSGHSSDSAGLCPLWAEA